MNNYFLVQRYLDGAIFRPSSTQASASSSRGQSLAIVVAITFSPAPSARSF